jgi:hypothetical protein
MDDAPLLVTVQRRDKDVAVWELRRDTENPAQLIALSPPMDSSAFVGVATSPSGRGEHRGVPRGVEGVNGGGTLALVERTACAPFGGR